MKASGLGIALSGGGARGVAHIGMLKVLEEAGIQADYISGTSMGGIIAAAYACGIPLAVMEQKALHLSRMRELIKLLDVSTQRRGLLVGSRVRDFLADLFLDRTFESMRIPLAIPAVDLLTGRQVVFSSGLVFPAVLATIAVPALFPPFQYKNYRLVDGGILNNLPIDLARQLGARRVIGVDVQGTPDTQKSWKPTSEGLPIPAPELVLDFYRAEMIMIAELNRVRLEKYPPDLLLCPDISPNINMFLGFPHIPEVIEAGERCAREALPDIFRLLD